jgi:hypothetical protein
MKRATHTEAKRKEEAVTMAKSCTVFIRDGSHIEHLRWFKNRFFKGTNATNACVAKWILLMAFLNRDKVEAFMLDWIRWRDEQGIENDWLTVNGILLSRARLMALMDE